MYNEIRVRFAPSPTGHLHLGSLRTAIFNWLFARHNKGKFLIRVEDTDRERSLKEFYESIMDSLEWMGLDADESIVLQSEQQDVHTKYINQLLEQGKAYRCYCAQKKEQPKNDEPVKYAGDCRDKDSSEFAESAEFVIRFKLPELGETLEFNDLIRGTVNYPSDQLDDFIIARSDGTPMYNFAVVVDDYNMKISHIIRGDDHMNNSFKQILLNQALGFELPKFAHLPLILNEQGSKLSKRDMAVAVIDYKKEGYLSGALFNYLVRLGWSHGDQEVFSKQELIDFFSLGNVGKSGAIFDTEKLQWLNTVYIKQLSAADILSLIQRDIDPGLLNRFNSFDEMQLIGLIELYQDRVKLLSELNESLLGLDSAPQNYDEVSLQKWVDNNTADLILNLKDFLNNLEKWDADELSILVKQLCSDKDVKLGRVAQPIRLALTGSTNSPSVFKLLEIFGKKQSLQRLETFLEFLRQDS